MAPTKATPGLRNAGFGVGDVFNTHHEGSTKSPTADRALNNLEKQERLGIFRWKKRTKENPMNNPTFGLGGGEKSEG